MFYSFIKLLAAATTRAGGGTGKKHLALSSPSHKGNMVSRYAHVLFQMMRHLPGTTSQQLPQH